MFILVYILGTLLMPLLFCFVAKKWIFASMPLMLAIDLLCFWGEFTYYESQMLMVLVTAMQIMAMFVISLILRRA